MLLFAINHSCTELQRGLFNFYLIVINYYKVQNAEFKQLFKT